MSAAEGIEPIAIRFRAQCLAAELSASATAFDFRWLLDLKDPRGRIRRWLLDLKDPRGRIRRCAKSPKLYTHCIAWIFIV